MKIEVNSANHSILAEGVYVTKSEPTKTYKKYKLNDNKVLVVSESEDFAYFGEDFRDLGIEPGNKIIHYNDKDYELEDHDYQILKSKVLGEPEGDIEFWDYKNRDEIISIGIQDTGERSDVVGKIINKNKVKF